MRANDIKKYKKMLNEQFINAYKNMNDINK